MNIDIKRKIDEIKALADSYKVYYGFAFEITIIKSKDFKDFMFNSLNDIINVLSFNTIDNASSFVGHLFENYDRRISGNHTGFSVLKVLFYVVFSQAIINHMNLNDSDTYIETIDTEKSIEPLFRFYLDNPYENWKHWYRGQSSFDWNLYPSLYRNINGKKIVHVDNMFIFNLYQRFGLIEKMKKTIGYNYIDYDFESFIQHAVSLSPLLDFSTNPIVATVMALSDTTNFKQHYDNDSALYEITIKDDKTIKDKKVIDSILSDINVYYCETIPFMETLYLHGKPITIDRFSSLITALTPLIEFIDIPSNDRMRYQSGKFVLFHECLILKDKVYAEFSKHVSFRVYRIKKELKEHIPGKKNLLEKIAEEHPEFSFSNMMNPYDYFSN